MSKDAKVIASDERILEVVSYALENGDEKTCETFGLTPETLIRYKRYCKNEIDGTIQNKGLLKQIEKQYSVQELRAIAKGGRIVPGYDKVPMVDFEGDCVTMAHITDLHMGSIYFKEDYWNKALRECNREKVDFIALGGDLTDGMSHRPGHIYELTHIGYDAQKEYGIEMLSKWQGPMYAIDGNHDRWYLKNSQAGALIVKDICRALPNATFIGHDEGDIPLKGGVVVKLWHGEDGDSYAFSYRLQKIIEAFTGGEKPNILLAGHVHKYCKIFMRHIFAVSSGALCTQSQWMRRTRKQNHTGFTICKAWINERGVAKFSDTFYPFYA